jgi:hypothetical protein
MLRSLLAGLLVFAIPCATLADPPRGRARERPAASSRAAPRPEAHRSAQARGPKPRAHVPPARPFGVHRPQPPRGRPRHGDRPRPARSPRECHEVAEPPQVALFLLGVGGLALLGRRRLRRVPRALEAQRQRAIR